MTTTMTTTANDTPQTEKNDDAKQATSLPKDRLAKLRDAARERDLGEKFYTIVTTCW